VPIIASELPATRVDASGGIPSEHVEPALDAPLPGAMTPVFPLSPLRGTPPPSVAGAAPEPGPATTATIRSLIFDPIAPSGHAPSPWSAPVQMAIQAAALFPGNVEGDRGDDSGTVATPGDEQRPGPIAPAAAPRILGSIEPLRYESPPMRPNGLEVTAELRINGRAAPGMEIDLFGFRYLVGPGGRFQLSLQMDDPELIGRALAQHPPPELAGDSND